ncbi:RagB/SusD family nutrient uptake outer membrane protein [Pedobacter africanus]|uniref:SusD family protein n=1 Tax=Pedobacter africanus TaxID=151894 RepID=A0A1W1ZF27_9SPHI|nr:RagB/SusD family nutrient uptake outer membrane protein [Pedobacter africanus]SMC47115.1 SusD family protein [Pedobacter africanus]
MSNKIFFLAITVVLLVTGCAKYTDVTPKGKNLLNRAGDLDMLMNVNYISPAFLFRNHSILVNDTYIIGSNVPNTISSGVRNWDKVLLTYDETADRAALATTDATYEGLYKIISTVANIAIANSDKASGDPQLLKQVKAEALTLRAYLHFLLVNVYAKAYDPATAATDGGVPYVDDVAFERLNAKRTVKEVYDHMLSDIDAAMASDALPDRPKNAMRVGKGFAYALKAKILLFMRNYTGALEAVNTALTINSTLEDHRPLMNITPRANRVLSRAGLTAPDNLFYAAFDAADPGLSLPTYEILNNYYEAGNIVKDHTDTYNYPYGLYLTGLPNIPMWFAMTYQGNAGGLTTSDLVLMKAECLIRTNNIGGGMDEVNKIRIRRIDPAVYTPWSATTAAQAMAYLQRTSRIEFLFTWRNFADIKRWNREGLYPVAVERTINGIKYVLPANSKLWVFPFPQSATQFNETLTQNY